MRQGVLVKVSGTREIERKLDSLGSADHRRSAMETGAILGSQLFRDHFGKLHNSRHRVGPQEVAQTWARGEPPNSGDTAFVLPTILKRSSGGYLRRGSGCGSRGRSSLVSGERFRIDFQLIE